MTNRALVLLSGEGTSIPEAEAKALFLAYDPSAEFQSPEKRVLLVKSKADPTLVGSRVAFARRVGVLISDSSEVADVVRGKKVRLRVHSLGGRGAEADAERILGSIEVRVDLKNPDFEFTLVKGEGEYLALSSPASMRQGWSVRRPRKRPFFHPSAIFPKLSRALVNLSRCRRGDVFLDPFAGTGSLPLEAALVGAEVVAADISRTMVIGAKSNMRSLGQEWLGVVRCDSLCSPFVSVDAAATDVPYGRASSTMGKATGDVVRDGLSAMAALMKSDHRMVLMHPMDVPAEPSSEWDVEQAHHLYVHKRLTRTITVLRRR